MSLLNSLFSGVSGLRNHQSMMDVIGNNISNVNTIGYKGSRVTFSDTFSQFVKAGTNPTATSGGTNTFQIGLGAKLNSIDKNWNQGTFERTGIVTDLALQGSGLFILKSNGANYYSRAGAFTFDANGNLVNPQNGAIVQGKLANGGQIPSGTTITDIKIDTSQRIPAVKTTETKWSGNLSSSSPTLKTDIDQEIGNLNSTGAGAAPGEPGVYVDPATGNPIPDNYKVIYDDSGNAYHLRTWYTYNAGTWTMNYHVVDTSGANINPPINSHADLTFNSSGKVTGFVDAAGASQTSTSVSLNSGGLSFDLDFSSVTNNSTSTSVDSKLDRGEDTEPVSSAVTIFDSLGNTHTLTITYTHLDTNKWKWDVSLPDTSGPFTGVGTSATSGIITFNGSDGTISSVTQGTSAVTDYPKISFSPLSGAEVQEITLDFGAGTSGITQTNLPSQVSSLSQNGAASATLTNMNIDQYGKVVGIFSNGVSRTLAQVMVATFPNLNGLTSIGDNMYTLASNSGDPRISEPGENSATTIQSGALEQSNVDLSEEFTRMIVSQRGFQANARVITTSDNLLQEITNLVR
ncbi:MAG: flagellar hook protein FlgE [Bacteroidota bacterium]|nr:flagellar hook-basal body complex protein [Ignavibacteria bacterium]HEX2960374.1 flagellar hook protein FlgE [Ignavibacteriales bacterium]MCU7499310.1 flagellar hook-basal body complex protein [Ignavibacteria bacterium]MCU7512539.1 flagellar hook-basal body complex protein [Ignavibacteria bacterium]MCU7519683.1 flagellar hook-basal body complex protein [Ignavibacteria bacterium]